MPSGGKREGAGRKRHDVSDQQLRRLIKAFDKKAKETGKTVQDLIADIAYNCSALEVVSYTKDDKKTTKIVAEVPIKDRIRCMELFTALTITKFSQKEVKNYTTGPTIGLPPMDKKPDEFYPQVPERVN